MMTIIPEIDKTAKLVQEIAAASFEQNNGSVQINNAIQQLNSITQQNASASEEMASNAEELTSQAEQLREIVSYFKVGSVGSSFSSIKPKKEGNSFRTIKPLNHKGEMKKGYGLKMNLKDDGIEENYTHF